jgi:hypothetical protein
MEDSHDVEQIEFESLYDKAPPQIRDALDIVFSARTFGSKMYQNGAIEINPRTHWNPGETRAFHILYAPLAADVVATLERDLGLRFEHADAYEKGVSEATGFPCKVRFSDKFKQLLLFSNGMSLFGGHMGYGGVAVLAGEARLPGPNYLPQSNGIPTLNIFVRPKNIDPAHAVLGSYPADGSCVVVNPDTEETYRVDRKGTKLNRWKDPFDYLCKEVKRMSTLFNENCEALTMESAPGG